MPKERYLSSTKKILCLSLLVLIFVVIYTYLFGGLPEKANVTVHKDKTVPPGVRPPVKVSGETPKNFLEVLRSRTVDDLALLNLDGEALSISVIDTYNNIQLLPRLLSIVAMDYFRFVKLNLNRPCTLWSGGSKCALRDCSIQVCDEATLPASVVQGDKTSEQEKDDCSHKKLSQVDNTVSTENVEAMNSLFECHEHDQEDGQYIDLSLNPERYTGYKGETAWRIWRSIYEENCFLKGRSHDPFSLDNLCYEEKIFYRAISGLHSSINIHLCALHHYMDGSFNYNLPEFLKRFQGNEAHLMNLYFLYLLELRALYKIGPHLASKVFWQSSGDLDGTREAIKSLIKVVRQFKWKFNESTLFKQETAIAKEFAAHFHNITTNIMDCIECDKCKLWGKVQIHGLGTAFKILVTEDISQLKLHRHEIVTLVNALTRLSSSIGHLDTFRKMLQNTREFKKHH